MRTEDGYDQKRVGLEASEFEKLPETAQAADEKRRVRARPSLGHELGRGVGVADPVLRLPFGGDLEQDHHLGQIV